MTSVSTVTLCFDDQVSAGLAQLNANIERLIAALEKVPQIIDVTNVASNYAGPAKPGKAKPEPKTAPPAREPESSTPQPKAEGSSPTPASPVSPQADAAVVKLTQQDLIAAGTKLAKVPATDPADSKTSGKEKLRAIFAKAGASNVTQIPESKFAEVLAQIQAATPA